MIAYLVGTAASYTVDAATWARISHSVVNVITGIVVALFAAMIVRAVVKVSHAIRSGTGNGEN